MIGHAFRLLHSVASNRRGRTSLPATADLYGDIPVQRSLPDVRLLAHRPAGRTRSAASWKGSAASCRLWPRCV